MKTNYLYNNIYETSIKILVLVNCFERELELQELIYYDYLSVHLGDMDSNEVSIHPANPYHNREIYCKRNLIQESLMFLVKKSLIDIKYDSSGIRYCKNNITENFINCFESEYFNSIFENSTIISEKFRNKSVSEVEMFIKELLSKTKDEFENEILFRGGYFEL